ncbi:SDR family NAD(P)-dependent oxidoreductase (plasmid) [Rhizobium sp. RCAM05350]|nr:SDR family NAD(P)-dependent oxidoreductase [Rhizobium sp. RCAM05350]
MLSGKTIVITGAASGIGQETARAAIGEGAKVIAVDLREPEFEVTTFLRLILAERRSTRW